MKLLILATEPIKVSLFWTELGPILTQLAGAIPIVVFSGHATIYPLLAFCVGGWCDVALEPGQVVAARVRGVLGTFSKTIGGLLVFNLCDSFDHGELNLG